MGGKTSTSTSGVSIPPDVLARYNSVNQTAEQVAQTPFQQYSTNPNAFVAPMTSTQNAGVANTNAAAGMAQPYYQAATGFALAGSQPVNAQPLDTSAFMNPYLQTVLGSTAAQINQNNQQAMAGQTGNAINQGYFGGDRSGIAAAVLQGQQNLAAGQVYSGIASDAYNQAMAAAQQQQGVQLGAAQANRAATQQTGDTLAGLGTTAQGSALAGAQAQLGAGQVEQQTSQAGLTALYNQFLQQQSYPFQTAQFLANIAEGTGALSGSTTTTTQPQSIFSDERLKEGIEPIGKGFDGANIIRFRYRGDPTTRIGMSAQEVERKHPEAVSEHGGFKAVDYGAATDEAADRGGFALAANDNGGDDERRARQAGGMSGWGMYPSATNPMVIQQLLESQAQMYGPYSGQGGPGLYGHSSSEIPHGGSGYVPQASLPVGQLQIARPVSAPQTNDLGSDIHEAASIADDAEGLSKDYHFAHEGFDKLRSFLGGGSGGDGAMNGGRVGRAPGGLTAADYAAQAAQARREAQIHAAAAAAHRDIAVRNARDRAAAQPDTSFGGRGSILGATGLPAAYHGAHVLADAVNSTQQGIEHAGEAAAPYVLAGMGGIGNWAQNQPWTRAHGPGWQPAPPRWVTDPNAYRPPPAAPAAAPTARPAVPAAAPPPGGSGVLPPAFTAAVRAAQIRHHVQQAQAHASAAQDLAAPTAAPTGSASPGFAGATGLPSNVAPVTPIDVGDVSHLQGGFAPADLHPYNPNIFQRFGNWAGDELSGIGRWLTSPSQSRAIGEDVAAANQRETPTQQLVQPVQSEAFQPGPVMQSEAFQSSRPPVAAAQPVLDAPVIQSEAFQPRDRDRVGDDLAPPITLAAGGFARAHRDMGGGTPDPSDPNDDNPYKPQGPGLNIPTAQTQHAKLATASPPSQGGGGGGLGQAVGMGSDLVNIAKFALPFFGVPLKTGGRVGYADGSVVTDDDASTPAPAIHDADATPVAAAADEDAAKQPGFAPAGPQGGSGHGGGFGGALASLVKAPFQLLGDAAGYEGHGQWDRDRLMPFLSAIGTMGATPTVHPLFALSQGLGAYGKSYMAQQQQEAQIAEEQAQAAIGRRGALPPDVAAGVYERAGPAYDPVTGRPDYRNVHRMANGEIGHWAPVGDLTSSVYGQAGGGAGGAPQAGVAGSPGSAGPGQVTGPVTADYSGSGSPKYSIGPSAAEGQRAAQAYGINPTGSLLENRSRSIANRPDQAHLDAAQKQADDFAGSPGQLGVDQANFREMIDQASKLPDKGLGAVGPGQGERQLLVQTVNTWGKMLDPNFQGFSDIDANSSATEILNKLSTLQSDALAGHFGQHAYAAAEQLRDALPSGNLQKASIYQVVTQMMVANQQARDFNEYRQAYQRFGIGDYGVMDAFSRDTSDMYSRERQLLPKMMTRAPGASQSMFEYLQQHPNEIRRVEQGYEGTDPRTGQPIHVPGFGPGFGKLFQ